MKVLEKAPKGPEKPVSEDYKGSMAQIPWTLSEVEGKLTCFVPTNLEALADNAFAQVAVVAANQLQCHYVTTEEEFLVANPTDQKVLNYLQGVSWAISGRKQSLPPCPQASGSMGHGFFYVAHLALDAQLGNGSYWARGVAHNPTKGVSGVAWDQNLDPSIRKIFSLITRAAKSMPVTRVWASYFRPKDSFLGKELKKTLPHMKIGLLTRDESRYLDSAYSKEIEAYQKCLNDLKDPQLEHLAGLADRFKEIGKNLTPLCTLVDNVITKRASLIYSKNKGQKKKQLKVPLTDLIANLDMETRIKAFDPVQLHGLNSFHVPDGVDLDNPEHLPLLSRQYLGRLQGLSASGLPSGLVSLCQQWCASVLGAPRRPSNSE
jgi:hypothetical protein